MRIVRVTNAADLRPLFEFRHRVYVSELAWLEDSGGLLVDDFDACADNYGAYDSEGAVVGSVRVVPDGPLGLPLEHCLPLNGYRDGKRIAEISRLAVSCDHRGSRLAALLMKAGYQRCLSLRVTHIALDCYVGHDNSEVLYDRMGFEHLAEPYDDPSYKCDLPVLSLALDVARAHEELPSRHPGLYRFFTTADTLIDHVE